VKKEFFAAAEVRSDLRNNLRIEFIYLLILVPNVLSSLRVKW